MSASDAFPILISLRFQKNEFIDLGSIWSLILVIAVTGARIYKGGVYFTSFDTIGWKHIQRWTGTINADESVWIAYKKIQSLKTDFNMLPFFRNREGKLIGENAYLHILAEKSHFIEDEKFFYLDAKKWAEYK